MKKTENATLENIVSLCKRRGIIYAGSEIYGGLSGTWDYGPLGVLLKENVKKIWLDRFVGKRSDMFRFDASILMNQNVWKASGHVAGFADPLVECLKCKRRFRADHLDEKFKQENKCPECGGKIGDIKQFNMMFKTQVGPSTPLGASASEIDASVSYLRPETAQGMFVNFKNIVDSFHPKLPFGMAQIGKAFRNEIAPRDFLFRQREFEQMEIEYFVKPENWKEVFEEFRNEVHAFIKDIGLTLSKVHELEVQDTDRAHYSKRTIDFEYDYPFGRKELYGLAYRTDFDLKSHSNESKVALEYLDEDPSTSSGQAPSTGSTGSPQTGSPQAKKIIPHCIEPSFGVDRTILAILCDAYTEDEMNEEKRVYLKLAPSVAPIKVAVFPLLKNKPELIKKAREVFVVLKNEFGDVIFDDNGNIGKRYRRQDEIGTPFCVTIDFGSLEKGDATVRDRDTGKQERVPLTQLIDHISNKFQR